jgi:hypothetical protein
MNDVRGENPQWQAIDKPSQPVDFVVFLRGWIVSPHANTTDDAVNVHGFYYYVVEKLAPRRYLLTPKWDIGLAAGDEIESCDHATFRSLGRTRIEQFTKRHAPELKGKIAPIWKNKSPTTQPDLIYDVVLQQDLALKVGDSVCDYQKLKLGRSGDEVRLGWQVT